MNAQTPAGQNYMRQAFKQLNRFMLLNWQLGMGPYLSFWPGGIGRFLVLVHTGRKTGRPRRTPVNYAELDGDIFVIAGFGARTHWYRNIIAQPQIEVWLPDGWWQAEAVDVSAAENRLQIMRAVMLNSGFAAYLAGINPHQINDEALQALTADYRLLRLRRTMARTGAGGPGEFAWVWPLLAHLLLLRCWRRRRQRRR